MKSVWDMIKQTALSWNDINAPQLGAALAFYTMLSIAPLLVMCIGIAGMVFGHDAAQGRVVAQIQGLVGYEGGQAIQSVLAHAAKLSSGIAAMSVGVLLLLFGASSVFGQLRDSMNLVWGVKNSTTSGLMGLIKYRFVSFAMIIGVGFLLLVSLLFSAAAAAAGKFVGGYLPVPEAVLHAANYVISFVAVTLVFALMYKVVPEVRIEWEDVWIGAAVTSALFSLGKFLIGIYLGKASIGSAYGAAGSLVVFLVWVYYSAQIFLMGAEFTRVFAERHGSRARARAERPETAPEQKALPDRKIA